MGIVIEAFKRPQDNGYSLLYRNDTRMGNQAVVAKEKADVPYKSITGLSILFSMRLLGEK